MCRIKKVAHLHLIKAKWFSSAYFCHVLNAQVTIISQSSSNLVPTSMLWIYIFFWCSVKCVHDHFRRMLCSGNSITSYDVARHNSRLTGHSIICCSLQNHAKKLSCMKKKPLCSNSLLHLATISASCLHLSHHRLG